MLYCGPLAFPWPKLPIGGVHLYVHLYPVPDGVDFRPATSTTSRDVVRRLGIILTSAGLVSAFIEGGNTLVAAGLALVGIGALVLGNLAHNP